MSDLYNEQAVRNLMQTAKQLLNMCQKKNIEVCTLFIETLKYLKTQYPSFASKANIEIERTTEYYDVMEWNEGMLRSNDKWFGVIEYNIKDSFGALYKIIFTVNPSLQKYLK